VKSLKKKAKLVATLRLCVIALNLVGGVAHADESAVRTAPVSQGRNGYRMISIPSLSKEIYQVERHFVAEAITEYYSERVCAPTTYRRENQCRMERVEDRVPVTRRECRQERDCGYRILPRFGCETHFGHPMECGMHTESRWACDSFSHEECENRTEYETQYRNEQRCEDVSIPVPGACHDERRSRVVQRQREADPVRTLLGRVERRISLAMPGSLWLPLLTHRERVEVTLVAESVDTAQVVVKITSNERRYGLADVQNGSGSQERDTVMLNVSHPCESPEEGCVSEITLGESLTRI